MRTARSITSGENFGDFLMLAPFSIEGASSNPGAVQFATLTQRCVRRGTHRSTRDLEQALHRYIELNNVAPKPFVWSKSADQILSSIERSCLRTSNSRHWPQRRLGSFDLADRALAISVWSIRESCLRRLTVEVRRPQRHGPRRRRWTTGAGAAHAVAGRLDRGASPLSVMSGRNERPVTI
jgi:hypothetical protein